MNRSVLWFRIIPLVKKFVSKREGGGLSFFSVEKFLSHSDEKFCRGNLLCFRNFPAPKNVRDKRGCGYHDFPSNLFILIVTKHFVKEPFCAVFQRYSTGEKVYEKEGGGRLWIIPVRFFSSHSAENFCQGTLLCFRKIWYRKMYRIREGAVITFFHQNCFVSEFRIIS